MNQIGARHASLPTIGQPLTTELRAAIRAEVWLEAADRAAAFDRTPPAGGEYGTGIRYARQWIAASLRACGQQEASGV